MTLLTDPGLAGAWTLAPQRSSIRFTNKTLWGLVPVNGRFTEVTGDGQITPAGAVTGQLVIRADSVHTGIGMRDHHLRGADFFDVSHFPEIVVEVTSAAPDGTLAATLGIRGVTLPVPLSATVSRLDDGSVEVIVRGDIDRTRWGVSGNMIGMLPSTTTLMVDAVFTR